MPRPIVFIFAAVAIFSVIIALDYFDLELLSSSLELSVVPLITFLYFIIGKNRQLYLAFFFVLYTIGDVINILDFNAESSWSYYVCNFSYTMAYLFLVLHITKGLSFKLVLKKYRLDFIVLLILAMYMVYVLIDIINPINFESNFIEVVQFVEFLYSLMLITVLSFSFLNYLQNSDNKNLLLFTACVLIAFSELVLIGYYYLVDDIRISYASSVLFVSGMFVLFFHTFLEVSIKKERKA